MRIDAVAVRDYNRIRVEPVTGSIGAEVVDIDLRDLDDEIVEELRDAWMAHQVLFFRDQEVTHQQHIEYGRAFGECEIHPILPSPVDHPEIVVLESSPESFEAAEYWHNDVTFSPTPPMGSILVGRVLPPYGGDTAWANMELAYDLLPDETKELLDGATAVHSYIKAFGPMLSDAEKEQKRSQNPDQAHPVVRTHPETGAKSLFVNQFFTLSMVCPALIRIGLVPCGMSSTLRPASRRSSVDSDGGPEASPNGTIAAPSTTPFPTTEGSLVEWSG